MSDDLDPGLWVRLKGRWSPDPELRWLIAGNAHTHRGRFSVVSPALGESRTVDIRDVAETSPDAHRWIEGFMAGQEPGLERFLGNSEELILACTDADEERWREGNRRFRATGRSPVLGSLPPRDPIFSSVSDPPVWTIVAGQFRMWDGAAWTVADPQPADALDAWAWPGSVCERRRHCRRVDLGEHYEICADCHEYLGVL